MKVSVLAPPKGWRMLKLGDCVRLINGRAYSQHELLDTGTPVIRIQNLNGGNRWYYSDLTLPEDKYCHDGDLLFAWSASFGPYIWKGNKSIFHYHIWRVIPNESIEKAFAFRLLDWITSKVKAASHGVAMLHMTKAGMEAWLVPVPPLPEQIRIAVILDQADALSAKRREALAQLDSLTQSIFIEMFGDTSKYPQASLESMCKLITDGTHQTPTYADTGTIFLSAKNVTSGYIDWERIKYIPESLHLELHRRLAPKVNDILLAKNGTTGVAAIVDRDCIFDVYVSLALLRPKDDVVPSYILGAINSPICKKQFNESLKGIGVPNLHLKEIRATKIPNPPKHIQDEFAVRIAAVEMQKTILRKSLIEFDALFASLQQRAFQGEL